MLKPPALLCGQVRGENGEGVAGVEVLSHAGAQLMTTGTIAARALGCLAGIATGDAVGKQTEMLSHEDVARWYPNGVRGFEGLPGAVIPRYNGKRYEWRIGETTDDTERTCAVARAILIDRTVSHLSIGREMLGCRKCVHPGVQSLWEFHQAADPARTTRRHDGWSSIGGDSDSVASIAGGILGARRPESVNQEWYDVVDRINGHDLGSLARELAAVRR